MPSAAQQLGFPVTTLACSSATTCIAVGSTLPDNSANSTGRVGVVTITNGTPGGATVVPAFLTISGIACTSTSTCQAVGGYAYGLTGRLSEPGVRGAVLPIVNGIPGEAHLTPGIKQLVSVACPSAGNCRAFGFQDRGVPQSAVLTAPITDGIPDAVEPVTGTASLGNVMSEGIACPSVMTCEAVGYAVDSNGVIAGATLAITPGNPTPVPPTIAALTYPTDGATGVSTNDPFDWSPVPAAQAYRFTTGSHPGGTDIADSGVLPPSAFSYGEPVMPPGPTLYATVFTELDGVWKSQSISFTVAPSQASFTAPLDHESGVDPTAAVTWTPIPQAQGYILVIGTTTFGSNTANSGVLPPTQLSFVPPILPPNTTLHATLLTKVNGAFTRFQAITFVTGPTGAAFAQPVAGASGVWGGWFNWTLRSQAQNYFLVMGTTPFGTNIYNSGLLGTYNYGDVGALPKGKTVYATLLTKVRGTWYYQAITFTT